MVTAYADKKQTTKKIPTKGKFTDPPKKHFLKKKIPEKKKKKKPNKTKQNKTKTKTKNKKKQKNKTKQKKPKNNN